MQHMSARVTLRAKLVGTFSVSSRRTSRRSGVQAAGDEERGGEDVGTTRERVVGEAVVDLVGVQSARVLVGTEPIGKVGAILSVFSADSENGLLFETWGREFIFVTPRSARRKAKEGLVIALPRSACSVNCEGSMPSRVHVSAMSFFASPAFSTGAIIQPTT